MNNQLFALDPMAGISYGLYNSAKKGKGNFEDFLLNYNSKEANKGNNNWLTKMIGQDVLSNIQASGALLEGFDKTRLNTASFLKSSNFLSTKATAYKLQLMQEMQKRGYGETKLKNPSLLTNFKNPLLS